MTSHRFPTCPTKVWDPSHKIFWFVGRSYDEKMCLNDGIHGGGYLYIYFFKKYIKIPQIPHFFANSEVCICLNFLCYEMCSRGKKMFLKKVWDLWDFAETSTKWKKNFVGNFPHSWSCMVPMIFLVGDFPTLSHTFQSNPRAAPGSSRQYENSWNGLQFHFELIWKAALKTIRTRIQSLFWSAWRVPFKRTLVCLGFLLLDFLTMI